MLRRILASLALATALSGSASATPMQLTFEGTYSGFSGVSGYTNPYASVGNTFSYVVTLDTSAFVPGTPFQNPTIDYQPYTGTAHWTGHAGSTALDWTGTTYLTVQDGTGFYSDSLSIRTDHFSLGPPGGTTTAEFGVSVYNAPGAAFTGSSLANLSFFASPLMDHKDGSFNTYSAANAFQGNLMTNAAGFSLVAVPEPSLKAFLSRL